MQPDGCTSRSQNEQHWRHSFSSAGLTGVATRSVYASSPEGECVSVDARLRSQLQFVTAGTRQIDERVEALRADQQVAIWLAVEDHVERSRAVRRAEHEEHAARR